MGNFLERYQILKLNDDHIDHLNSHITPKEIEAVTEKKPKNIIGPDGYSAEFYQTFTILKISLSDSQKIGNNAIRGPSNTNPGLILRVFSM